MSKLSLFVVITGALMFSAGLYNLSTSNTFANSATKDAWVSWKQEHGKAYGGLNKFSDLSAKEFAQIYLTAQTPQKSKASTTIPVSDTTSIDWTTKGAVTDVKDQGQCGSCWAFSTTGSLEGLNFIKAGYLKSFAEQQLVDCDVYSLNPFKIGNMGCRGGSMVAAFMYTQENGMMQETDYPYVARDHSSSGVKNTCAYDTSKVTKINTNYEMVPTGDNDQLLAAIAKQPISVGIYAEPIQHYKSGIYNDWTTCTGDVDHGVLAVGFGEEKGVKFWKIKNSWGKTFGEDGFFRLERKEGKGKGICQVTENASYPTKDPTA